MATKILGLVGRKQSGKDTFATRLVEVHGFTRLAFGDPLKAVAEGLNPFFVDVPGGPLSLAQILSEHPWDEAKETFPAVRQYLQALGMAVRNHIGEDTWVQTLAQKAYLTPGPVVVTDVRFPNEARWIRGVAGETVRILRPVDPAAAVDPHESETALDAWVTDHIVHNDHTIAALHTTADLLMEYATTQPRNTPGIGV